jgi:hypothetical protein
MKESQGSGWIKLHRQITKWEWYTDTNTKSLFLHLVLMANHKPCRYKGMIIETGCLITGQKKLSIETGLTVSQIRTALNHLKSTNEIAIKTTTQGTHIEVVKYEDYQIVANDLASEQRTTSERLATNKNEKNKRKKEISLQATPVGENLNFNTPEKMSIEQELDAKLFWDRLLKIYNPVGDKSLHNTSLKKQREKIILTFTVEEREKILEWFTKYKTQLEIAGTWLGNFFKDHQTIDSIAEYFRSIKDVKSNVKNKSVGELLKRNTKEDFDAVQAYDPFANK